MFVYIGGILLIWYLCWWMRDKLMIERVSDKYVFITGCDTGFGYLAAKTLDRHGFRVFAGCLTESGSQELKKETSERLKTVKLDVTNSNSIENATEQIRSAVGDRGLWGLINNSGISGILCPTDWLKIEHFRTPIEVNLLGSIEVTLKSLPLIKKARGRVVNISSVLGRLALGGGGYYPSKFGMEAFNDSLRRDMRSFGINVSCIEPGVFETKLTDCSKHRAERRAMWDSLPSEVQKQYGEDYLKQMDDKKDEAVKRLLNTDLSLVVWCMQHALTAKYPRTRYSVGIDAKLLWIPLTYLPTFVADYLLTKDTVKIVDPNAI
ncbi:dehydrogenase/reductase SDR family member 9 [Callorhinchus milii]|uniref:Dehydrogenase/reductase 9 n=1 Tax=Callorhinchus milii TaxID=7868 RepID=V9KX84_CALMI|nr:dehydrogenase/reductase SDR family member 9 [Callorhinchus milii]XP_007888072.1 dehydrogenase/reductase SDR family member 9 [Callorhinchus milii]XP_007888073.1 dehydrogenase/reductase SDR family member 9 [Callorhinchus milii]|eukprot:gi/632945455/ref/XP_007888071.1/ PREDICTED: dehydrogenase/reductase SDR family member 9 [Callorhinchus milii]